MSQMRKTMMTLSDILQDEAKEKALFKLRGYRAQCLIDFLDYFLSDPELRSTIEPWLLKPAVVTLCGLCEVSMLHPTRHVLTGIRDMSVVFVGAFCDIYQGRYDRQRLCLKAVRMPYKKSQEKTPRLLAREAILWSQLDHPNVVPFYGIFYLEQKKDVCLVSPWMENSDIMDYLKRSPQVPRKPFIHDIINGLQYLHAANIIHGDLTGRKVLIDEHQHARLADFGLSTIVMDDPLNFTIRWAPPERLKKDVTLTCESDVWAFGCVCYEVLTGMTPFMGCSVLAVASRLMKGESPAQLDNATLDENENLNKKLRELVKRCWSIEAEQRPGSLEVLREIESIPIVRHLPGPNPITARKRSNLPGFWLRTPGSAFSTNLNRGREILEELYHVGNEDADLSDAINSSEI